MIVVMVVLYYAAVVAIELPGLRKQKQRGERWAFFVLTGLAFCLQVAISLRLWAPNPSKLIDLLFGPLSRWLGLGITH